MTSTSPFGGQVAVGIQGIGTVVPVRPGKPGGDRDELVARWKNQVLGRSISVKTKSGNFAAYSLILPSGHNPADGYVFPIGDVKHVTLARRINKNNKGKGGFPFFCPTSVYHAGVGGGSEDIPPIGICRDTLEVCYDLSCQPGGSHKRGHANAIPRTDRNLLGLALDMEEDMVACHLGIDDKKPCELPIIPRYYAAFDKGKRPDAEECRQSIELVMDVLKGDEGIYKYLPPSLSSPGGVVKEIKPVDDGALEIIFKTSTGEDVSRFILPMGMVEPYVQEGVEIAQGARIGHYATPRKYPSWKVVKNDILKQYALGVLDEIIASMDVEYPDHILRDVIYCPRSVLRREHKTVYEDVSQMVGENGRPIIQVSPYHPLFSEFVQNGCKVHFNIWNPNVIQG